MTTPDELERAVDRLEKAMKIADQYAAGVWFGEGNDGFVSFATILAILSERAELLATVERMRVALEHLVRCDDDARCGLQNGAGLLDCIDNHGMFYPSADLDEALTKARSALTTQRGRDAR